MSPKGRSRRGGASERNRSEGSIVVNEWAILAPPLFLDAIERLASAAEKERAKNPKGHPGPNTRLLAHLLDLAFVTIPADPGGSQSRHGGTLGGGHRHWFRAKTGGGRYRLFYRFHSPAKVIVLAWVNDEETLRTYGRKPDAYQVFSGMLESGNPPDDWSHLLSSVQDPATKKRLRKLFGRMTPPPQ
ncbi:MAG: type II toxin-antitoxin system YhaV family toxin [Longimicrobiales bacterium]|nr:type II toxin-antitoxin system YhaV family toxin [Longimicrobiales bacterium]